MPNADADWMKYALDQAKQANDDVPVGCVIVHNDVVIATAHNLKEATQDVTAHAEIVAIRSAEQSRGTWRLDHCVLYTTLEPCAMCAEALIQARVSRLVFGAYDLLSGAAGSKFNLFVPGRPYPVPIVSGGILEDECQSLLKHFFRGRTDI